MAHIVVLDSGAGGLSIMTAIARQLPGVRISYVTDSAQFPYGDLPPEQLVLVVISLLQATLHALDAPDVIVIACNTASTQVLSQIRQQTTIPVVGVVPAIKPAGRMSKTGVFGVLATPSTINSRYLYELKNQFWPQKSMICCGSTPLVAFAQAYFDQQASAQQLPLEAIESLFTQAQGQQIDTLVLACTHFPLIADVLQVAIASLTTQSVTLIDSGLGVAAQVERMIVATNDQTVIQHLYTPLHAYSFYNRYDKHGPLAQHELSEQYTHYIVQNSSKLADCVSVSKDESGSLINTKASIKASHTS